VTDIIKVAFSRPLSAVWIMFNLALILGGLIVLLLN